MDTAKEKLGQAKEYISEKVSDTMGAIKDTARAGAEKVEHLGETIKEKAMGAKEKAGTEYQDEKERLERMSKAAAHVPEEHKTRSEL